MNEIVFINQVKSYFLMKEKDNAHEIETSTGIDYPYVLYIDNIQIGCMYLDWSHNIIQNNVGISYLYMYSQKKGYGSKVLEKVCELADIHGITLFLDAVPQKVTSNSIPSYKLKSWYSSFGFIPSKIVGSNDMEREPNF